MAENKSSRTSQSSQRVDSRKLNSLWKLLVTGFWVLLLFLIANFFNAILSAIWPKLADFLPLFFVLVHLQPWWLRLLVWCGLLALLFILLVFLISLWKQKKAFERADTELHKDEQRSLLREELGQPLAALSTELTTLSAQVASTQQQVETYHRQITETAPLPTLLTPIEFMQRVSSRAIVQHDSAFIGRQSLLDQVQEYLVGTCCVLVLHGPGGIGKTRLLLSLSEFVPSGTCLWFVRTEGESIEQDLIKLDPAHQHVLVVDDAHRFTPLAHLREVLVNPALAGKVKLILATRSVFKETVTYPLGAVSGDQITAIEVSPMRNADIDQLLQNAPFLVADRTTRHTLIQIADGNPLIASIAARLVDKVGTPSALTRDQVLTRYLNGLLHDLETVDGIRVDCSIRFLEVLAALGTIDLSNNDLRARVQEIVGVSPSELDHIVRRLLDAGLVERYWHMLKIASDVLADHILVSHFFDPQTRQADYQRCIIEPFFALKPKEILTHLAEAEVKGESSDAGTLLGGKLAELSHLIKTEGNVVRLNILSLLDGFAFLRPDDILTVIMEVVDGDERPSEIRQNRLWGTYEIGHEQVLGKAIDLLNQIIYRGDWPMVITYLHKLATYQPETATFAPVRKKASDALIDIARLRPHKPYALIKLLLESAILWGKQKLELNLDLILAIVQSMLSIEIEQIAPDPTRPMTILIERGAISQDEALRQIRQRALEALFGLFQQSDTLKQRLKIVHVLTGALAPINSQGQVLPELREWLHAEGISIITFFSEVVIPKGELPIIDNVAEALWRARRFAGYSIHEIATAQKQIQDHRLYQLYRLLVGGTHWVNERGELDWKEGEQARQKAIEDYLDHLTPLTIDEVIQDLATIVEQARMAQSHNLYWLNIMLEQIGERLPHLANQLIEQTLAANGPLKQNLSFILAGLRRSEPDTAWNYIHAWANTDDFMLLYAVAHSYSFIDAWNDLSEQDWQILRQLVVKENSQLDHEIVWLIQRFAPFKPDIGVEFLKLIAARADEHILHEIAITLTLPDTARSGWAVEIDPQDYLEIIANFERVAELGYAEEDCLKRLGTIAPMQVIDFFERRINTLQDTPSMKRSYSPVPFHLFGAMESIRSGPAYREVLQRVRDWMLREGSLFIWETPRLLRGIAGTLDEVLQSVLMEWIVSDDRQKQLAIARILLEVNNGEVFYALSRELILRTTDEHILGIIQAAIGSTPKALGAIWGSPSEHARQRMAEVSPWLQDESIRVRRFAQQTVRSLQSALEFDQGQERFRERTWQ